MITFQEIRVKKIKLGTAVKRVYKAESESEARSFANLFYGFAYENFPDEWCVII